MLRLTFLAFLIAGCASTQSDRLAGSRQLIVVTAETLQRYERRDDSSSWIPVGDRVPVVVGRNGLAPQGTKREGDGRAPSGIFALGTAFGFAERADFRYPYRQVRDGTECVDDSASRYYNQLVDRDFVPAVDWRSSERMRAISVYRWGIVVNYNTPAVPERGSCIFLHIWSGASSSTAGCTAMPENALEELLRWLDPAAKPKLMQ